MYCMLLARVQWDIESMQWVRCDVRADSLSSTRILESLDLRASTSRPHHERESKVLYRVCTSSIHNSE